MEGDTMNQQQPQHSPKKSLPRTTGRIVLKITLYFVGFLIAEFGLLGGVFVVAGSSVPVGCSVFSVDILVVVGSIFIFFRKRYYIHCLSRLEYLWWVSGTSVAFFMTLVLVFGVANPNTNRVTSAIVSSFFLFYGISLMWIAHRKPPLAQQINESVYRILQATPGKQIAISDLFARLQKEYKHLNMPLNQYLDTLDYIEPIRIPGIPAIVCRMKPPKQTAPAPQMTPPVIKTSPLQTGPAPFIAQTSANQAISPSPIEKNSSKNISSKPIDKVIQPPSPPVLPTASEPDHSKASSSFIKEQKAIQTFCCYAHTDEQLLNKLKAHLKPQQREGLLQIWYDRDISAGTEWEQEIEEQLNTAQIILLLVSPDFMASDYCYTKEMQRALERHNRGEIRAIPIILRPVDWQITPLGKLQALPKDGRPITTWSNRDNAYLDVARGIRAVVETFLTPPQQAKKQVPVQSDHQKQEAEIELTRARCKQGKLIITNKKIAIELNGFGQTLKSQTLLKSSLSSIDSKLAVAPLFGKGGGINLTFRGRGKELLTADLVPVKEAKEIIALLSGH